MSNYKTVFFTLGILQIILAIFMLIPLIVQFIYNEKPSPYENILPDYLKKNKIIEFSPAIINFINSPICIDRCLPNT